MSNYGSYCFRNIDSANPTIFPADGSNASSSSSLPATITTATAAAPPPPPPAAAAAARPPPPGLQERNAIAEDLHRLFRLYCHTINARDYTCTQTAAGIELKPHISPLFRARWDGIPHPLTWHQLSDMWKSWARADPDMEFNVKHGNCDVDLEKGQATLYAEVAGKDGLLNLCGLVEVQWKRMKTGGRWVMVHYWGIRGIWEQGGLMG